AKHPIVMIPGFVTSGLELWAGRDCFKKHFRQRLWGSVSMARTFLADRECWREHLSLDPKTGMDPPNIRLRSAQGFEAADNFVATYWVWSKLIENLADVGYDGSMMTMMAYDWRLGYELMETRDGYFTKLKHCIEAHFESSGEKVVIASHSMGGTVVYYFLNWVVTDKKYGGGGGGKDWIEKYVHAFINISGTLLGVPKAVPALLSGELKDIAAMLPQLGDLLEQYFGRRLRKQLWNTWGSLFGMLPKGGDAIWGIGADIVVSNTTDTTKYDQGFNHTDFTIPPSREWSTAQTLEHIFQNGGGYGPFLSSPNIFSHDSAKGWSEKPSSKDKRKHWHDPVATPLPRAPSLKIYCIYGVGLPTERAYHYKVDCDKAADSIYDDAQNVKYGVLFSDGDASVPLISLGYMCQKWAEPKSSHNPSGIQVVTREKKHTGEVLLSDPGRGGPLSGEHVDILGNVGVIEDFVRIATG
ncbi:Phospholipid:diacylglycerol acyltransferase, partial [Thalassiosira pseudonana CCMP1335]